MSLELLDAGPRAGVLSDSGASLCREDQLIPLYSSCNRLRSWLGRHCVLPAAARPGCWTLLVLQLWRSILVKWCRRIQVERSVMTGDATGLHRQRTDWAVLVVVIFPLSALGPPNIR